MDDASEFQRLIRDAHSGRDSRGRRYSEAARALAVRYCRKCRDEGASFYRIASDLGVGVSTLERWLKEAPEPVNEKTRIREVRLAESSPASRSMRVTFPNGLCVEGLGTRELIELIRGLS